MLADVDYLQRNNMDNEYFFQGFLFTPINRLAAHQAKVLQKAARSRGGSPTRRVAGAGGRGEDGSRHAVPSVISDSKQLDPTKIEFRWRTGKQDKYITVEYIKAHKESFIHQIKDYYFNMHDRRILTFHFMHKANDYDKLGGTGKQIYLASMSFHLFIQQPDNTWASLYSYPRWLPICEGVFASEKFIAQLGRVQFSAKKQYKGKR